MEEKTYTAADYWRKISITQEDLELALDNAHQVKCLWEQGRDYLVERDGSDADTQKSTESIEKQEDLIRLLEHELLRVFSVEVYHG